MLRDLIRDAAKSADITQVRARRAVGIILNTAERQGSPFAQTLYKRIPGARTLSARTGSDLGCATGLVARMIEQTPGGRRHVAEQMMKSLHAEGFGHSEISGIVTAISAFAERKYGITGFGHLGDLFGGRTANIAVAA